MRQPAAPRGDASCGPGANRWLTHKTESAALAPFGGTGTHQGQTARSGRGAHCHHRPRTGTRESLFPQPAGSRTICSSVNRDCFMCSSFVSGSQNLKHQLVRNSASRPPPRSDVFSDNQSTTNTADNRMILGQQDVPSLRLRIGINGCLVHGYPAAARGAQAQGGSGR